MKNRATIYYTQYSIICANNSAKPIYGIAFHPYPLLDSEIVSYTKIYSLLMPSAYTDEYYREMFYGTYYGYFKIVENVVHYII